MHVPSRKGRSVMVVEPIHCPTCQGTDVVKHGKTSDGKQRFRCQNETCTTVTFIRDYVYRGRLPAVKQQIIDMSLHATGIRDIARVLQISTTTVLHELKKAPELHAVNPNIGTYRHPEDVEVAIHKVDESALDKM